MRVLIADDDATSRLVLKAMVSKLGHECLVADGRLEGRGSCSRRRRSTCCSPTG